MRKSDDVAQGRWVNWSWLWALFGQGKMNSRRVVIGHVGAKHSTEMSLVENNEVVEAVSANRADQPLDIGILPG